PKPARNHATPCILLSSAMTKTLLSLSFEDCLSVSNSRVGRKCRGACRDGTGGPPTHGCIGTGGQSGAQCASAAQGITKRSRGTFRTSTLNIMPPSPEFEVTLFAQREKTLSLAAISSGLYQLRR